MADKTDGMLQATAEAQFQVPRVLAQELASFLERQIIFLDLPPGARLVEEEIGQAYGVSRSPVREALRLLETDGLVVREPRRGMWVAPLSLEDANEVYACRLPLETLAAGLAVKHATDARLEELGTVYERMAASVGDIRAYFDASYNFTLAIHRLAGNRTLRRLLEGLGKQSRRYRYLAYSQFAHLVAASVAGNKQILDAIRNRNTRVAKTVTTHLIQNAWDEIAQHLKQNSTPDAIASVVPLHRPLAG